MLVYGDPQFVATLPELCGQLRRTLGRCGGGDVDELRALMIQAGQLEQGVEDGSEVGELAETCRRLTDEAAVAFYAAWAELEPGLPRAGSSRQEALRRVETELERLRLFQAGPLTIKVPEGFEFYALYPEQYALAALRWARGHADCLKKSVLVVGLRSIGTTLSALVAVVLRAAGLRVWRKTMRPSGEPFARKLDFSSHELPAAKWAIIVDEGPGLSGSSLAGCAEALIAAGFNSERVAIFPGHEGEPGSAATPEIRQCWKSLSRYFVPLEAVRWGGRSLTETLSGDCEGVDDLSAGLWRGFAYKDLRDWPAVAAQFERMKFRVRMSSGAAILWKFIGLGALVSPEGRGDELILGAEGRAPERLLNGAAQRGRFALTGGGSTKRGFMAQSWVEGVRLTSADGSPELLRHLARYLVATAGTPLSIAENEGAVQRLAEMLFWNTKKGIDESATGDYPITQIAKMTEDLPAYSDGRMAPHEWVRSGSGGIFKTDSAGHNFDHTLVGRQSIAWDIAGVMVEWKLSSTLESYFIQELTDAGLIVPPTAVAFFRHAYAAFRLGQMKLALLNCSPDEKERLSEAVGFYGDAVRAACTRFRNFRIFLLRSPHRIL